MIVLVFMVIGLLGAFNYRVQPKTGLQNAFEYLCFSLRSNVDLNWINEREHSAKTCSESLWTRKGFWQVNTRIRSDLLLKGYLRSGYVDTRIHLFLGVASKSQCFLRLSIRGRRSVFSVLDMTYLKLNICQAKILCLSHFEKEMRSLSLFIPELLY